MSNTDICPADVARRVHEDETDDLFVLDIRNEDDYSSLEDHLDELPTDTEIAVVCVAGITSVRAAEFLREHGFDAKSIDDGMNGWVASTASTTSTTLTASSRSSDPERDASPTSPTTATRGTPRSSPPPEPDSSVAEDSDT